MEIKIFGKSLFEIGRNKGIVLWNNANDSLDKEKRLPDFKKWDGSQSSFDGVIELREISQNVLTNASGTLSTGSGDGTTVTVASSASSKPSEKEKKPDEPKKEILTPKGVYELKMLDDTAFELKTDPDYVDGQISDFKDKLSLIKSSKTDMRRGIEEISSIIVRMENRKKYASDRAFFEEYPYTTNTKINSMLKEHTNLKLGQVEQFIADMPKEAVTAMKEYNKHTEKLCGKQAVFYIIADKKDFRNTDTRRDPILLAQSPFGHFWQIIGAWDEEMLFLEEL